MAGSSEELWQKAVLHQRRIPVGTGASGAMCDRWALGEKAGCWGTAGAFGCQRFGMVLTKLVCTGALRPCWRVLGRGLAWPWLPGRRKTMVAFAAQRRVLLAAAEEVAFPLGFRLLPWEFASAISWNMNLFIFKGEQT